MKKRRELDALVNGGKQSASTSRTTMKNGRHELLRNDSDSSEVEEFAMPQKNGVRNKRESYSSQCCSTCLAMCSGFLLVLCIVAVGGLVWMNIRLKNDVYVLQNRLTTLEQLTRDIPERLHVLTEGQDKLTSATSGLKDDSGQPVLKQNVDSLSRQLQMLNSSLLQLAQSQASASTAGLRDLQDRFMQLTKNVADLGSQLKEVQGTQKSALQQLSDLGSKVEELQLTASASDAAKSTQLPSSPAVPSLPLEDYVQQQFRRFSNELSSVNDSLNIRVGEISSTVVSQALLVTSVQNETQLLRARLGSMEKQLNRNTSIEQDSVEQMSQNSTGFVSVGSELYAVKLSVDHITSAVQLLEDRTDKVDERLTNVETVVKDLHDTVDTLSAVEKSPKVNTRQNQGVVVTATASTKTAAATAAVKPVDTTDS